MAAQSIERRRALAGEQLARPMVHQLGLVVDRTRRQEPLARTTHRLVDRRCVNLVAFVAAHVGQLTARAQAFAVALSSVPRVSARIDHGGG
jgi:hypothetical protein